METNEILKGNKLIAEFMKAKNENSDIYYLPEFGHYFNSYGQIEYNECFRSNELKYHSSWDWLMPIVAKIFKLGYVCVFYGNHCCIQDKLSFTNSKQINKYPYYIDTYSLNEDTLIEAVFEAIVKFIKWYNDNKNEIQ